MELSFFSSKEKPRSERIHFKWSGSMVPGYLSLHCNKNSLLSLY